MHSNKSGYRYRIEWELNQYSNSQVVDLIQFKFVFDFIRFRYIWTNLSYHFL